MISVSHQYKQVKIKILEQALLESYEPDYADVVVDYPSVG